MRRNAALAGLVFGLAFPSPGRGCLDVEPTDQIAIDLGGGQAAMLGIYVAPLPEPDPGMSWADGAPMSESPVQQCLASIFLPLSAFPTSRLAHRPVEIARSMREAMKKLDVATCEVAVFYDNDTNEEIPEHELCLQETFAFGQRKHWSISRESFCWEPADSEFVSNDE